MKVEIPINTIREILKQYLGYKIERSKGKFWVYLPDYKMVTENYKGNTFLKFKDTDWVVKVDKDDKILEL